MPRRCVIVGAGCMGVSTAIALKKRSIELKHSRKSNDQSINQSVNTHNDRSIDQVFDEIILIDRSSLFNLHPLAASNDLSRIVRSDYGADRLYTDLAQRCIEGWEIFNQSHCADNPVFIKSGVAILTEVPMINQSNDKSINQSNDKSTNQSDDKSISQSDDKSINQSTEYERSSYELMKQLNQPVTRLDFKNTNSHNQSINQTVNLMNQTINETGRFVDGYFNANAGWVDAGRATELAIRYAHSIGVDVREHHELVELVNESTNQSTNQSANQSIKHRVTGVKVKIHSPTDKQAPPIVSSHSQSTSRALGTSTDQSINQSIIEADQVILCCGAWTPSLIPYTKSLLKASAQPVFYFDAPSDNQSINQSTNQSQQAGSQLSAKAQQFADLPVFAMSLSSRGFYGFPLSKRPLPMSSINQQTNQSINQSISQSNKRVIKIAHHGPGSDHHPSDERVFSKEIADTMLDYIYSTIPSLRECAILAKKTCFYCDAVDGDWLIDSHRDYQNVIIASGDSGHAFKFLPVMGDVIVGILTNDSKYSEHKQRFQWRESDVDESKAKYDVCRAGPLQLKTEMVTASNATLVSKL